MGRYCIHLDRLIIQHIFPSHFSQVVMKRNLCQQLESDEMLRLNTFRICQTHTTCLRITWILFFAICWMNLKNFVTHFSGTTEQNDIIFGQSWQYNDWLTVSRSFELRVVLCLAWYREHSCFTWSGGAALITS